MEIIMAESKTKSNKVEKKVSKFNREGLTYLNHGLFSYKAESLEECKDKDFFNCADSRNLGVRSGDVVIVTTKEKAELIVVK